MSSRPCPNCGFVNRPSAKCCGQCGRLLPPVSRGPALPVPISPPASQSPPAPPVTQPISPVKPLPNAGYVWDRQPDLEGRVAEVRIGRVRKVSLGRVVRTITFAALKVSPWLMDRDDTIEMWYVRVEEYGTGQLRQASIEGTPTSDISIDDGIALWGKDRGGTLVVKQAFNYKTRSYIGFIK